MGEHRFALSFHQPSLLSQPTVCLDVITDQSGHSKAGAVEKARSNMKFNIN